MRVFCRLHGEVLGCARGFQAPEQISQHESALGGLQRPRVWKDRAKAAAWQQDRTDLPAGANSCAHMPPFFTNDVSSRFMHLKYAGCIDFV